MLEYIELISLVITAVSAVATVIALVLAGKQTRMARLAQHEAAAHTENLSRIEDALTTRYRGEFPGFIQEVAHLIDRAESKLELFYDVPGYGVFSDPPGWLAMRQAIERKTALGVAVSVSLYSPNRRREVLEEQMNHRNDKEVEWPNPPDLIPELQRYLVHEQRIVDRHLSSDSFIEISLGVHEKIFTEVFGHLPVVMVEDLMPLYFWIIDGREAIFAIPAFGEDASEFGFFTSDPRIIKALRNMKKRYRKRAGASDA